MAYTSEIEKLERRFAENPKGRNFAPLADAYRKAGEVDKAIDLCRNGLEIHPDYVSAHIVLGRCLLDQKNQAEAEQVFRRVLELDPENILSLRMLGDLADRRGRPDEAVQWLERLLGADPMNGDAADALARAKGKVAAAAAAATKTGAAVSAPTPLRRPAAGPPRPAAPPPVSPVAEPAPIAPPALELERASATGPVPTEARPAPPSDLETFDGTVDFDVVSHEAAKAEGLQVEESVSLEPEALHIEGLASTQYESGTWTAPPEAPPEEDEGPPVDLPLILPDDMPAPRAASPPRAPAPPPHPAPPVPAAVALSDDDGAADAAALSRAEPVVTETMAELYVQQGHTDDALRVYAALLTQRPDDARLRARVSQLTGRPGPRAEPPSRRALPPSGQSAPAFLRAVLRGASPAAMEPAPPSTLAGAFAEPGPEAMPGAPTAPAGDDLSLESVFGDVAHAGIPSPLTPAEPTPTPTPSPPAETAGGFSFDDFFGAGAGGGGSGGGGVVGGAGASPAGPPPGRPTHPPAEDEGDLDQFHEWLKKLKA